MPEDKVPHHLVQLITLEEADKNGFVWLEDIMRDNPHLDGAWIIAYKDTFTSSGTLFLYWETPEGMKNLYSYMYRHGSYMTLEEGKKKHSGLFI